MVEKLKIKKKPFWNLFKTNIQIIENGGWHFSFLKNPESIKKKLFLILIKNIIKNLQILNLLKKDFFRRRFI